MFNGQTDPVKGTHDPFVGVEVCDEIDDFHKLRNNMVDTYLDNMILDVSDVEVLPELL